MSWKARMPLLDPYLVGQALASSPTRADAIEGASRYEVNVGLCGSVGVSANTPLPIDGIEFNQYREQGSESVFRKILGFSNP